MIDLSSLTLEAHIDLEPEFVPGITPVSFRDIDMSPPMDMHIHCADPCLYCGAFNMLVGDYVFFGSCSKCYETELKGLN